MPTAASVYVDFQGLASLRARSHEHAPESLREAARQFEALFAQILLKSMREASLGDGIFDSEQAEFYREMFDQQMSLELTRGNGLGLAELIVRQLEQAGHATEPAANHLRASKVLAGDDRPAKVSSRGADKTASGIDSARR